MSGSSVAARENVTAAICWRVAGVKKCECARNKEILAVVGAARRGTRIGTRIERRRRMRYTPRPCSWNPGSRSRPAISRGKLETMRHRSHREKPVPLFGSISAEIAFHFYIIAKIRMRYREKGERPRSGFWRIFRNDDRRFDEPRTSTRWYLLVTGFLSTRRYRSFVLRAKSQACERQKGFLATKKLVAWYPIQAA